MGLINRVNNVPKNQRLYQAAYRNHQRIWAINPASRLIVRSFSVVLFGTVSVSLYGMVRKVAGYNSYF